MSLVEDAIRRLATTRGRPGSGRQAEAPVPASSPGSVQAGRDSRPRRSLDFAALRAGGLIPAEHERQMFSRTFRGIKRPLLASMSAANAEASGSTRSNILMVASAVAGDGKTFTALNLAMCFALERDLQVVLVDGDVIKRGLSEALGFGSDPGLVDLLQDSGRSPDEYTIQTDVPRLAILPAGTGSGTSNATELLTSARMRQVADHFAGSNDCVVVFDSPPLLPTTESRAIAELAGQVVLVVREGHTTQSTLMQVMGLLQGSPSVSLVMNQSLSVPHAGYGYQYEDGENLGDDSK